MKKNLNKQDTRKTERVEIIKQEIMNKRYREVQDLLLLIGMYPGSSLEELELMSGLRENDMKRRMEFLEYRGLIELELGFYYSNPENEVVAFDDRV